MKQIRINQLDVGEESIDELLGPIMHGTATTEQPEHQATDNQ